MDFPSIPDGTDSSAKTFVGVQGTQRNVPLVFFYPTDKNNTTFITKLINNITSISVNYTLNAATAVTFELIDPGLEITKNNYFQVGQTFVYRSHNSERLSPSEGSIGIVMEDYLGYFMEVADVTVEQKQGNSPMVRVQGYTKAIQQMKRDRNPGAIKGTSHDFVVNAAKKYGLKSVVQETTKERTITQADGEKMADSLWDVLTKLAGESKDANKNPYIIFESDGTLYFCTQQWLMYKRGHDSYEHTRWNAKKNKNVTTTRKVTYLHYPARIVGGVKDTRFILNKLPTMHHAENDPMEGDGSCTVDRVNGVRLRPGMTVNVGEIPWFTDDFLITSVDYAEMVNEPVSVSFATPPRQENKIKPIEVGEILPGSVEWATIEGLYQANPLPGYTLKAPATGGGGGGNVETV